MKKIINRSFLAILFFLTCITVDAQQKKTEEIKIRTSAVCTTCKKTLEHNLIYEKGIKSVLLDVDSKTLTVQYNPERTNADLIRKAVSGLGYDADSVAADPGAYKKLKDCCKKENESHKE